MMIQSSVTWSRNLVKVKKENEEKVYEIDNLLSDYFVCSNNFRGL